MGSMGTYDWDAESQEHVCFKTGFPILSRRCFEKICQALAVTRSRIIISSQPALNLYTEHIVSGILAFAGSSKHNLNELIALTYFVSASTV
jgi:hypothetical protein